MCFLDTGRTREGEPCAWPGGEAASSKSPCGRWARTPCVCGGVLRPAWWEQRGLMAERGSGGPGALPGQLTALAFTWGELFPAPVSLGRDEIRRTSSLAPTHRPSRCSHPGSAAITG